MPWSRALYEVRRTEQSKSDPHARCLPPGGPRQFHTPYGLLLYEIPEAKRVLILSGGGPHMWRVVYTDGRPHPPPNGLDQGFQGPSSAFGEGTRLLMATSGLRKKFSLPGLRFRHPMSVRL